LWLSSTSTTRWPYARPFDDPSPFGDFRGDGFLELIRRAQHHFGPVREQALFRVRLLHHFSSRFVQKPDDLARCSCRRKQSVELAHVEARQARLGDRGHLGQQHGAVRAGDADRTHALCLDRRQRGHDVAEHQVRFTSDYRQRRREELLERGARVLLQGHLPLQAAVHALHENFVQLDRRYADAVMRRRGDAVTRASLGDAF
jgi:hypothetical protein